MSAKFSLKPSRIFTDFRLGSNEFDHAMVLVWLCCICYRRWSDTWRITLGTYTRSSPPGTV